MRILIETFHWDAQIVTTSTKSVDTFTTIFSFNFFILCRAGVTLNGVLANQLPEVGLMSLTK